MNNMNNPNGDIEMVELPNNQIKYEYEFYEPSDSEMFSYPPMPILNLASEAGGEFNIGGNVHLQDLENLQLRNVQHQRSVRERIAAMSLKQKIIVGAALLLTGGLAILGGVSISGTGAQSGSGTQQPIAPDLSNSLNGTFSNDWGYSNNTFESDITPTEETVVPSIIGIPVNEFEKDVNDTFNSLFTRSEKHKALYEHILCEIFAKKIVGSDHGDDYDRLVVGLKKQITQHGSNDNFVSLMKGMPQYKHVDFNKAVIEAKTNFIIHKDGGKRDNQGWSERFGKYEKAHNGSLRTLNSLESLQKGEGSNFAYISSDFVKNDEKTKTIVKQQSKSISI